MPAPLPTGDAAAMGLLHHLETRLERQILAQLQAALQQALEDYQPLCDSATWPCIATIVMPAPLPPATAKSAYRYPCSAAANVTVWPAA